MGNWFGSSTQGDYGDIMKVETSGASDETSDQDNLDYSGVCASEYMAKADLKRMRKYKDEILKVAAEHKVDPALIAGIISRESRAGNTIKDTNGWGDRGRAFGLMQIDTVPVRNGGGGHTPRGAWDSQEHLSHATGILVDFIEKIQDKFPNWSLEEQLKGGIAAYNQGDGKVESRDVDKKTTGGDYANDVVARAQWYRSESDIK